VFPGPGRFNGGIQGEKIRLVGNPGNQLNDRPDLSGLVL